MKIYKIKRKKTISQHSNIINWLTMLNKKKKTIKLLLNITLLLQKKIQNMQILTLVSQVLKNNLKIMIKVY